MNLAQSLPPEQVPVLVSAVERGGPIVIVIVTLTVSAIALFKYIGTPALVQIREIVFSNQQAMSDLRSATQNSKDTASANMASTAANVAAAEKLATIISIVEKFRKES